MWEVLGKCSREIKKYSESYLYFIWVLEQIGCRTWSWAGWRKKLFYNLFLILPQMSKSCQAAFLKNVQTFHLNSSPFGPLSAGMLSHLSMARGWRGWHKVRPWWCFQLKSYFTLPHYALIFWFVTISEGESASNCSTHIIKSYTCYILNTCTDRIHTSKLSFHRSVEIKVKYTITTLLRTLYYSP